MNPRSLSDDCVLARTPEGTRRMRDRSAGLPARLRSVLFLVDGLQTVRRILDRAGQLAPLLESQLAELVELGLLEGAGAPGANRAQQARLMNPENVAPIVGAKMQLLDALERLQGGTMAKRGSALIEARSWRELAARARALALVIQEHAGSEASSRFWSEAKEILVTCRGAEAARKRA